MEQENRVSLTRVSVFASVMETCGDFLTCALKMEAVRNYFISWKHI